MTGPGGGRRFVGLSDRFELVDHIGSGGFGDVWRAREGMLGREAALKFLALDDAIKEIERDLDASGAEQRVYGSAPGPNASVSGDGFADQLSAVELTVRRLVWKHGHDHALVITARRELADLTGHSGDVRGAAELYDLLGRDCTTWFGPGHSRTLDVFEGMARWVSA
ncbi:hypothetical protein [Streptomyces sp. NPDC058307]|uniref:hypothetical protein n=1 Tax=Streptomyces sp. NPDC058307 TaxID=3346439 RepID=UPI0036E925E8